MDILIVLLLISILVSVIIVGIKLKPKQIETELLIRNSLGQFKKEIEISVDNSRREMYEARQNLNNQGHETLKLMKQMEGTIQRIISQQEEANKLGQSLKDILKAPKLRGNYGEVILEELLEKVLPKGMWSRQYLISSGAVVDVVIHYKDMVVPIDSKFPRDNYTRYLDARDEREKAEFWKSFEKDVILRMREISKYVRPDRGTADFALMFIPSEAVYYETIAEKTYLGQTSKILEESEKLKVLPVSPNTFYAFLQIVLTGMKNLEVLNQAREIQEKLYRVEKKFDLFYKQYDCIGRELEKAYEAYRKGDKHINAYQKELKETLEIEMGQDRQRLE
ncbi:MAG: DNA recombination protein RmuC [Firmicutes bacterium]|nr:DNA recombination protein RmuC [Bacillota bacterium]MDA8227819.1 DNA recombination protein RmuC [Desulfitobacterium hafniense]